MGVLVAFILMSLYLPIFSFSISAATEQGFELWQHLIQHFTTQTSWQAGPTRTASGRNARKLAERYRCGFVDLLEQRIDPELFRTIPADLMFRFNFVPLELQNNALVIAVADPSQVLLSDEFRCCWERNWSSRLPPPRQISDLLKRTEQSQRVLEQATEAFTLQVSKDDEESDETFPPTA